MVVYLTLCYKVELDMAEWTLENKSGPDSGIPSQTNGIDCGVFVTQYADHITRYVLDTLNVPVLILIHY